MSARHREPLNVNCLFRQTQNQAKSLIAASVHREERLALFDQPQIVMIRHQSHKFHLVAIRPMIRTPAARRQAASDKLFSSS
ncbi:MAG: hypothetical protein DME97_08495 [Verrucomicrobia bacterium]|nr:MAG: hypothetical protein DME97_08495 [Verrucomicrobiota bacterium]